MPPARAHIFVEQPVGNAGRALRVDALADEAAQLEQMAVGRDG